MAGNNLPLTEQQKKTIYFTVTRDVVKMKYGEDIDIFDQHALDKGNLKELRELETQRNYFDYGNALMDYIFPVTGKVRRRYQDLIDDATGEGEYIRIRLQVEHEKKRSEIDESLDQLWWECLRDNDYSKTFCNCENLSFSRTTSERRMNLMPPEGQKLKMLMVVSNPRGLGDPGEYENLAPLYSLEEEEKYIQQIRDGLNSSGISDRIEYDILYSPASYRAIRDALQRDHVHILHIIAHGDSGSLLLEDDEKQTPVRVSADSLYNLTNYWKSLCLVVLVVCHSASSRANPGPFVSLAQAVTRAGVPNVIAMQDLVSFDAGELFTNVFYQFLGNDKRHLGFIDDAVRVARYSLTDPSLEDDWAWAKPVLYMNNNGRLPFIQVRPTADAGAADSLRKSARPPSTYAGVEAHAEQREGGRELWSVKDMLDASAAYIPNLGMRVETVTMLPVDWGRKKARIVGQHIRRPSADQTGSITDLVNINLQDLTG